MKTFISLGNLIINFHFVTFTIMLFDSEVWLLFNDGNALNLRNQTQTAKIKKIEREQFLRLFPEKKKQ